MEFHMDEFLEEDVPPIKKPNTGLAAKYARKQQKEDNILKNLLAEQTKKYGPTELVEDKKSLSIKEAREIVLQPILKKQATEAKAETSISLNEAVDIISEAALNENWKDNIDKLSPGTQDVDKKLLNLANQLKGNKITDEQIPVNKTDLLESKEPVLKNYSIKEAMNFVHSLQEQQKNVFLEDREHLLEQWSDNIAKTLIENKSTIIVDENSKKIIKVV